MKIALIWINYQTPIPQRGYGAIEKYTWQYYINLKLLGHDVVISTTTNDNNLKDFDIVQSHSWNQCLNLHENNIPYIFSFDDTHVIYYGKDSELYKNNLLAMKHSLLTIVHSKYLLNYFGLDNMVYLRHGADKNTFKCLKEKSEEHSLLTICKTDQDDRKNIKLSIDVAQKLNIPITVVGPNDNYFNNNKYDYEKLTIIGNTIDEDLVNLYNDNTIFIHPSKLETGHPNLTLIESIFCGTPVVGMCHEYVDGLYNIKPNFESVYDGVKTVINDYKYYRKRCLNNYKTEYYDWYNITKDLEKIYKDNYKK